MLILGVSGANDREHDPAACLIKDGKLIAMVEEERFCREKHAPGIPPHNSIQFCLDQAEVSLDDIDYVALGWNYQKIPLWAEENTIENLSKIFFPKDLLNHKKEIKYKFYDHHLAHAASSFLFSDFKDSYLLVMDGQGETESTSIGFGFTDLTGSKKINFIKKYPIEYSLGYMYDKIGEYIGLGHWSAGKLMGLSPYGSRALKLPFDYDEEGNYGIKFINNFVASKENYDDEDQLKNLWSDLLTTTVGQIITNNINPSKEAKNLALTAQNYLEKTTGHILKYLIGSSEHKSNNICISGGVGLNCSNNSFIRDVFGLNVFVQPAANDAGVVLGAAALCSQENGYLIKRPENVYFGPDFGDNAIEDLLKKNNLNYHKPDDLTQKIAEALFDGCVVGWFQGKMEYGPRALGGRSILAKPDSKVMLKKINTLKGREHWRPLAPIVCEEDAKKYFGIESSPFMLFFTKVNERFLKTFPAITHVDGTTRPQTVDKSHKLLHRLLSDYKKLSGHSVLINTSFNIKGEPIVCSPEDAISSFLKSELDILAIGNYIVRK